MEALPSTAPDIVERFNAQWLVDDRTLYFDSSYPAAMLRAGADGQPDGPSPYAIRWVSIIRQWCLPLLFWVSGAAVGCSYRGGVPRGLAKLVGFSLIGMSFNAVLWFLSPRINECLVDMPECAGKGVLFDFSICGRAGMAFAIVFQMWYTILLFALTLANWPMFAAVYGAAGGAMLAAQWVINVGLLYAPLLFLAGSKIPSPMRLLAELAGLDALFVAVLALNAPRVGQGWRPSWMPVRLLHYLLAGVVIIQFGALRFADEMKHIGPAYLLYGLTGFNRFFGLGFVMTHDRQVGPTKIDTAQPLLSRAWPVMLLLVTAVAPSTNWDVAGMLTYPFFADCVDRCLYVAGAVALMFILDRVSRGVQCMPLPNVLGQTSLLLYLIHPVLITVLLWSGRRSVMHVWLLSVSTVAIFMALFELSRSSFGRKSGAPKLPKDFDNLSVMSSPLSTRNRILSDSGETSGEDSTGSSSEAR